MSVIGRSGVLGVIVFVALALRLGMWAANLDALLSPDSVIYLEMAMGILEGNPIPRFPNGYPLIIAGFAYIAGDSDPLPALILLNVILSTSTVWLIYQLAEPIVGERDALLAALLTALWPNQIYYSCHVMSEVPAMFLLVTSIWLLFSRKPLGAGLLLVGAALIRSSLAPVTMIVPALWLLLPDRRREVGRLVSVIFAGYLVDYALCATGVVVAASNVGENFLMATRDHQQSGAEFTAQEVASPFGAYLHFALTHPRAFLELRLTALFELWGPWPDAGDPLSPRSPTSQLLIGLRFPLFIAAAIGFWRLRHRVEALIIACPIAVITLVHTAFFSWAPRYTHPVEPLALVLAVAAFSKIIDRLDRRKHTVSS